YTRTGAAKTLWKEMEEVQRLRNAVVHRGETHVDYAALALATGASLLKEIFPLVLRNLNLHLHDPGVVCDKRHTVGLNVYFPIPGHGPAIRATVEVALERIDFDNMLETINGWLVEYPPDDLAVLQSATAVPMWITSTLHQYDVLF